MKKLVVFFVLVCSFTFVWLTDPKDPTTQRSYETFLLSRNESDEDLNVDNFLHFRTENKTYVYMPYTTTYFEASHVCKYYGMNLLTIRSEEENDFLLQSFLNTSEHFIDQSLWTGGDILTGHWLWSQSAEPIEYFNWRADEPNDRSGAENCLEVIIYRSGLQWNDKNCGNPLKPSVTDEMRYIRAHRFFLTPIVFTSSNKFVCEKYEHDKTSISDCNKFHESEKSKS